MNDLPEGFEVEGGGAGAGGLPPGFEVDQSAQAKPSIFAPVSAAGELGARGINAIAQALPEGIRPAPRAPQPLQPFGIGSWQPSMAQMGADLAKTVQSGVTLPGDVYAGKVDPLSEEGIRRAYDLGSITPLSTLPTVGTRAASAAIPAAEIKGAGAAAYDAVRARTRGDLIDKPYAQTVSDHMRAVVEDTGAARQRLARDTHELIDQVAQAKDVADLVDTHRLLGKVVRQGGEDGRAAMMARDALEEALGPQISGIVRTADRNYAIGSRAGELEQKVVNQVKRAENRGSGGNVGNSVRQAIEPLTMEGAKNVSPEVLAAAERVTKPGMGVKALRVLSSFDPTSSKLMAAITMKGMNPLTWPTAMVGAGSRMLYDRIMKQRAADVANAIRREAPANLVSPTYFPGGVISLPGAFGANTGILAPLETYARGRAPLRLTVRPSDAL